MRDPTNQDDIGWGSSCRRYRNGFRNAWLPFQRHFLMVNLEFFRCRRFGNAMRYTLQDELFPSLYRFPKNIHSLASFTRWNNAAFIGFGFSVLQAVEGSEITTHIRGDHEASMNLFLGKIWHLKVHYENHIHILYTLGFRGFFGGGPMFLEPYYICILFHYIHVWKITYQPEFTPISVFFFFKQDTAFGWRGGNFLPNALGFCSSPLLNFTVRFVVGFFGQRNIACPCHEVDETMEKLESKSRTLEVRDGSFQLDGEVGWLWFTGIFF